MPAYQYKCMDCQHQFEITRSYSDSSKALPRCEQCGSRKTKRIITASFAISGSGGEQSGGHSSGGCGSCSSGSCSGCSHCG